MACQLIVDLYGCDNSVINDLEKIKKISHGMIEKLHAGIVEECCHQFHPIGITYIAVITTSHFSIHTWPEYGYAAVDVFSCDEDLPEKVAEELKNNLKAKKCTIRKLERDIKGGM